ncbi:hypothetical protein PUR34_38870 [Streptomyces sp. JV185]|uniref:hypothetical protein n=1 Tax=Streptomyces sp. JV185 TaxID=858638 RepID=UPI002E774880|nr:hypothetical protein [Streptomyces sp. JV185]MEE1773978.1 hypothetical protein [Streptomyces sp. JV185]
MTGQPGPQPRAFIVLAAALTGSVAERSDECGDDFSDRTAGLPFYSATDATH